MLDQETKRKIDSCRDILVGKVPDPKAQVEQITTALIYKFMDDIDMNSVELGGKPSFFVKEYEQYSWTKVLAPQLGGQERLNLYVEAISKMAQNPYIPQLFRDIFKDAFLPYRDPETLRLFLKEINEFTYDHSEKLGDSYEYLLSIMSSQGDAGQFRTPRNIIDFIVELVDPKKDETVLDPACGTAGFLISGYKHILKTNKDKLTPDEKARIMTNLVGYDISPDMVRMSLVNMYLHGFPNPNIFEYDTLTSEKRWDETFDVVMANPPFMTPKGGIRPHNRFSVKAKRSEVLFVDYIAEHLSMDGRAGVIIPEGIIFQAQNAYKQLRKNLVDENILYAVVSLPAGVFNPYSGVKTSILLMDKNIAKKTDSILFVKIENDGFDLGAQRKQIEKSDLPEALDIVNAWKKGERIDSKMSVYVEKTKLAKNGEYNLSGDRYCEEIDYSNAKWAMVELGEVCDLYQPKTITSKEILKSGQYKVFGANGIIGYFNKYNHEDAEVLITCRGATCGTINLSESKSWITGNAMVAKPKDVSKLNKHFLFYLLRNSDFSLVISGAAQPQITRQSLSPFQIPLLPLEMQEQIVVELDNYKKIIDGAKQVVENYMPNINVLQNWAKVSLGDLCKIGGKITKKINTELPYIGADSLESNTGEIINIKTAMEQRVTGPVYEFSGKRILYSKIRPYLNKLTLIDLKGYCSSDMYPLIIDEKKANFAYISNYMLSLEFLQSIRGFYSRASIPKINRKQLFSIIIPLPTLKIQDEIVEELIEQKRLINANKKLIDLYEQKVKNRIAKVWREE